MKQVAETGNSPGGPIVFDGLFDQHEEETDQDGEKARRQGSAFGPSPLTPLRRRFCYAVHLSSQIPGRPTVAESPRPAKISM